MTEAQIRSMIVVGAVVLIAPFARAAVRRWRAYTKKPPGGESLFAHAVRQRSFALGRLLRRARR